jgi:hypothetical protein
VHFRTHVLAFDAAKARAHPAQQMSQMRAAAADESSHAHKSEWVLRRETTHCHATKNAVLEMRSDDPRFVTAAVSYPLIFVISASETSKFA